MDIHIIPAFKGQRLFRDFTDQWTRLFLKELNKEKSLKNRALLDCREVSIVFVKAREIKKLNKEYRGKNKVTDVLSFSGDGFISLGEIILCQEELKKKSRASNLNLKHFSQFMICHSLLHLLGYTHEDSLASEKEMLSLQNKMLKRVASKLAPERKNEFDISWQP
jgi:probable rRNA maturation factor